MKRMFFLLLLSFVICSGVFAQGKAKADSEIINDFKATIRNNEFLDFRMRSEALKPIKTETLKTHKVYKDLLDLVKSEEADGLMREISIDLLLFFKAESHEISGLESDLISLLLNDNVGWYIKNIIIKKLPNSIASDNRVDMDKLKNALVSLITKKPKLGEDNSKTHLIELKRTAFGVLDEVGVLYSQVKTVVESELKEPKSDLKTAILLYLEKYSISHRDFTDSEVKGFCRLIFKNVTTEYSVNETASAIKLYGNMLANENAFPVQGSDEEYFLKFLKNENDAIIIAAAKSLYRIKSTNGVEKIVERLQEVMTKSDAVRMALIDALIYMEHSLIYSKDGVMSPSKKKEALTLIKDKFMLLIMNPAVKGPLQDRLFDAMLYFGMEHDAAEYIDMETIKKFVNLMGSSTEDTVKERISKILNSYTGEGYGIAVDLWVKWVKEESQNPRNRFK
jgi:hypothetical protein